MRRTLIRCSLFAIFLLAIPAASFAQIGVFINVGPPALPVYEQPPCPAPAYIWSPGYWAWSPNGYYWVPGTWVMAPQPGLLWTPGFWAFENGGYGWHPGYWGPVVGFYGGVPYGYGYPGSGFYGGRWNNGQFYYNRTVNNVNVTNIHNVYNQTVINNTTVNNVSYNGGPGGIAAQPTAQEKAAALQPHTPPTFEQTQHETAASTNHALLASVNHGKPEIAATAKPGQFSGAGVVKAKGEGAPYNPAVNHAITTGRGAVNPGMHPGVESGNPRSSVPRPPNAMSTPVRPAPAPAPATVPRPATSPRLGNDVRSESSPQPASPPRPANQVHPQTTPQPAAAHPAPHPVPKPQPKTRPEEEKPH